MDRTTQEHIVERCLDFLARETDPARREALHGLLVEEEDRFGARRERLPQLEGFIARGEERIGRQREFVASLAASGLDTGSAEVVLANLLRPQSLFRDYRGQLLEGLARTRL